MKRKIKGAFCPKCNKKLFRVKVRRNKPTTCNYCGFLIENPFKIFIPKTKYLDMKKND